jgi:hypothetical protein
LHPPGSPSYPRCASLIWCSLCRDFTTYLVHVDAEESLVDPLAALDPEEQDRIRRGEYRLVAYLDRLNPPGG